MTTASDNINSANYWQSHYDRDDTNWDMGKVSPPLKAYFDSQLSQMDKSINILIAGAGNAYEASYLHNQGFENVYVVDFVQTPLDNLAKQSADFPKEHLIQADFFALADEPFNFANFFDLAIEQTFFCAITPDLRPKYVEQMQRLLKPTGKVAGVLWDCYFAKDADRQNPESKPPFGGTADEYHELFADKFEANIEPCKDSHPARLGRELFVEFLVKNNDS